MTTESKQERDRRYARDYRARKRAADVERARAASDGAPGPMRQSVDAAVEAMRWLTASDAAAVAQARAVASLADAAKQAGEHSLVLRAHGQLSRLLAEIGGTPRVRMQLELRSRRLADSDPHEDAPPAPANVTALRRPEKRR